MFPTKSSNRIWRPILLLLGVATAYFTTFENIADARFFLGFGLPWRLWKLYMSSTMEPGTHRTYEVRSCANMDKSFTSQVPILFKNCTNAVIDDLMFFEEQSQNVFPTCDKHNKKKSTFTFEPFEGETQFITEVPPCENKTLADKLSTLKLHNLTENNSYTEVHPYMMNMEERRIVRDGIDKMMLDKENNLGLTTAMVAPTMNYFFNGGEGAIGYPHAHLDHFLSFCLSAEKIWTLIDPLYFDHFDSIWSGNAQTMVKEKKKVHKLIVKQEKGDILYVPAWWMHHTKVEKTNKAIGLNFHFGVSRQIMFAILELGIRVFDNPSLFFSNSNGPKETKRIHDKGWAFSIFSTGQKEATRIQDEITRSTISHTFSRTI